MPPSPGPAAVAEGRHSTEEASTRTLPIPIGRMPDPLASLPDPSDPAVDVEELRRALALAIDINRSKDQSLTKLQQEVDYERGQVKILRHDVQRLRKQTVDLQLTAETEEEYISNTLLKRIADMKKEKTDLLLEVEREEEYLTNTLQKKLTQLQREKIDLENALEQEQERLVNQLQRQLDLARTQSPPATSVSSSPASSLGAPTGSSPHQRRLSYSFASPGDGLLAGPGLVEMLKSDVHSLRLKVTELEKELITTFNRSQGYKREVVQLRTQMGRPTGHLTDDDDVTPNVVRLLFPDRPVRARRSMSSSQSDSPFILEPTASRRASRTGDNLRRTSDIGAARGK
ncbi:hypothetical protein IWQ60_000197 [Tieghemiomyces parasiticus]|uniref:Uncharacterized protein n=1 Tax=Tieghemiomyces parasiticus TaxID=78921 RepID=A0A9W8AFA7_9FUNG|nr:hypothetical protein IWQ60_000197 [Tieghemiomyces parasiticus]